jgi:hypothetical protein
LSSGVQPRSRQSALPEGISTSSERQNVAKAPALAPEKKITELIAQKTLSIKGTT